MAPERTDECVEHKRCSLAFVGLVGPLKSDYFAGVHHTAVRTTALHPCQAAQRTAHTDTDKISGWHDAGARLGCVAPVVVLFEVGENLARPSWDGRGQRGRNWRIPGEGEYIRAKLKNMRYSCNSAPCSGGGPSGTPIVDGHRVRLGWPIHSVDAGFAGGLGGALYEGPQAWDSQYEQAQADGIARDGIPRLRLQRQRGPRSEMKYCHTPKN